MNLVTYDPFRELRSLQDEVNRLFSSSFSRKDDNELTRGAWSPNVDIYEDNDKIVLEAELPGVRPEDVTISIENNVLTIYGERKFEKKEDQGNFHRVERSYGSFTRSFTLPPTVSADGAEAQFENGVLRLMLKKREEAKPRRIEIKPGDPQQQPAQIDTSTKTGSAKA